MTIKIILACYLAIVFLATCHRSVTNKNRRGILVVPIIAFLLALDGYWTN